MLCIVDLPRMDTIYRVSHGLFGGHDYGKGQHERGREHVQPQQNPLAPYSIYLDHTGMQFIGPLKSFYMYILSYLREIKNIKHQEHPSFYPDDVLFV